MTGREEEIAARLRELAAWRDAKNAGLSQQAMADKLNAEGLTAPSGRPWSRHSVRRFLNRSSQRSEVQPLAPEKSKSTLPGQRRTAGMKLTEPLLQWSYYESIRAPVERLVAKHGAESNLLNYFVKSDIPTADGSAWDQASVARVLKVLKPVRPLQLDDDSIRERIRQGWYDTDGESFICVRKKRKTKGKKKTKGKAAKPTKGKKKKKRKK